MKLRLSLLFWVGACTLIFAQDNNFYQVVAEQGDGIFSLLRKQGLDPAKHYGTFLELNSDKIKEGSALKLGEEYKVPYASDSFKKKGVLVEAVADSEAPIFNAELSQMSVKSDKLKDAVYYLIVENKVESDGSFTKDIAKRLAAELMEHGAQVYVMGEPSNANASKGMMGEYVKVINKRYLQNMGKYQRVLLLRAGDLSQGSALDVAVYHYNKSEQGQRFAHHIQNVFKQHSVSNTNVDEASLIFEDENSLYLAKNILPAISLLSLESSSKTAQSKISLKTNKTKFANMISNGIMNDYADLEFEN